MLVSILVLLTPLWLAFPMRTFRRSIAIANAENIVDALDQFQRQTKNYPDSLEQLVPIYLDRIPSSGIIGIGGYDYENWKCYYDIN